MVQLVKSVDEPAARSVGHARLRQLSHPDLRVSDHSVPP
jgi:hypothetical protein